MLEGEEGSTGWLGRVMMEHPALGPPFSTLRVSPRDALPWDISGAVPASTLERFPLPDDPLGMAGLGGLGKLRHTRGVCVSMCIRGAE